jgi:hypothetical protein
MEHWVKQMLPFAFESISLHMLSFARFLVASQLLLRLRY